MSKVEGKVLGERIRDALKRADLSQEQLGVRVSSDRPPTSRCPTLRIPELRHPYGRRSA